MIYIVVYINIDTLTVELVLLKAYIRWTIVILCIYWIQFVFLYIVLMPTLLWKRIFIYLFVVASFVVDAVPVYVAVRPPNVQWIYTRVLEADAA